MNERRTKTITICNLGEFNFDCIWKHPASRYLTIAPESGSVKKGSKLAFEITYAPVMPHTLSKYKCSLSIISGPTYDFIIKGTARKPGVEFNTIRFDFGKCFVFRQPQSKTKYLEIKNVESTALSIDLTFEKKPYMDIQLNPGQVLLPYTTEQPEILKIPIIFTPRDICKYEETATFDFNGIYKTNVVVVGEGIPLVLELSKSEDQMIDFGIVKVGGDATKAVNLVNKSKRPVTFSIELENTAEFEKCNLSLNVDKGKERTLKPNESFTLEVRYQPSTRMPAFKHDILLKVGEGETRHLTTVTGVSHGIEVKLLEDSLSFGSVVKGSRLTKQIELANVGDIEARFAWDKGDYRKDFTIYPDKGHLPSHESIKLEIVFHPHKVNDDIAYSKIKCSIEGGEQLALSLFGRSVEQSKEFTQDVHFETEVRRAAKQQVAVDNPTAQLWTIRPTISTGVDSCKDYFVGVATLEVPPKTKANYEVTYCPLTMTPETSEGTVKYHEASLFFPLPDGSARLYKLFGKANKPNALDTIRETATAKKPKFIGIPVNNWLGESQQFSVTWDINKSITDPATFIRGANRFDVGAHSTKEYKLNFLAYKAGKASFSIRFNNDTTKEYAWYNIELDIAPPEPIATLELSSVVRESVSRLVTIENPLDTPVSIDKAQFAADNEHVFVTPESLTVAPHKESAFEVNFRPLVVESKEAKLTLNNPELGVFTYNLVLNGLKSTVQRSLHFKASLGTELVQTFRFTNYVKTATSYAVKIERIQGETAPVTEFKAEQAAVAAPPAESNAGVELMVNVKFEPNNIGDTRAIMKITNPNGVEYTCLLYGHGMPPQPQPITKIQNTKAVNVEFKNPLSEKYEFTVRFDNPCFTVATKMPVVIDSGKAISLPVRFDFKEDLPPTGRMLVTTKGFPAWIYYLHGEK
eukprot:TRINITY_DN12651_c0_g2_i3.p1 TRINITY_DN12651_c0_g2~~TRINITY_DN12651_c0_g2_i3.p1  ORF type:complete len:921 (+),score=283.65 TRINITY_DN12651_c0_g2_i3:189-2951(+)